MSVWDDLFQVTLDIEDLLGTLRGNEAVREYFERADAAVPAGVPRWGSYNFHSIGATVPPDPDLAVNFSYMLGGRAVIGDGTGSEQQAYDQQLWDGAKASWDSGRAWASGTGGYLRDSVRSFALPDPSDFRAAAMALRHDIDWIQMCAPDFASNTSTGVIFGARLDSWAAQGWTGESAIAFRSFYDTLASKMTMYADVASASADLVAGSGALVRAAQTGLIAVFEGFRDGLRLQCEQWMLTQGSPMSYKSADLGWIVDLAGIGKDIAVAIPIASNLVRVPGAVVSTAEGVVKASEAIGLIDKYVDIPEGRRRPRSFTLDTAEAAFATMVGVLQDDLLAGYDQATQTLADERSRALVQQVRALASTASGDWYTPRVDGITTEKHW